MELGLLFELGEMIPQDLQRVRELYSMADEAANMDGTLHLAILLKMGVPEDLRTSNALHTKAGEAGHAIAQPVCMLYGLGRYLVAEEQAIQLL